MGLLPASLFWKRCLLMPIYEAVSQHCACFLSSLGTATHVRPEAVAETSALTFTYLFAKSVRSLLWPLDVLQLLNHKYADAKLSYPGHSSHPRRGFCCICFDRC